MFAHRIHVAVVLLAGMSCFAFGKPQQVPLRPDTGNKPLEATTGIQLLNIYSIDSRTESFDADLYLWVSWYDSRAKEVFAIPKNDNLTISQDAAWGGEQKLWNPYLELNTSALASQDREVVTLYPSGMVEYGSRVVGQFKPPQGTMNFRMFPFDSHSLRIEVSSFVYKSGQLVFQVDKELILPEKLKSIYEKVRMQEWKIKGCQVVSQIEAFTGTNAEEQFSVIGFEVNVIRKSSYYILRWVVPLTLILILAWLALFLPASRLDVQASTVSAAFLSLVALNFVIASDLAHCDYLTLFDHGLVIAYITVLLVAIIVVGGAQIQESAAQQLFHRARLSLPVLVGLLNLSGAILFSKEIPDRTTICIDLVIFLFWSIFVAVPLVRPQKHR